MFNLYLYKFNLYALFYLKIIYISTKISLQNEA